MATPTKKPKNPQDVMGNVLDIFKQGQPPNAMDQALAQPVAQSQGFQDPLKSIQNIFNQNQFTQGGKHVRTNTDGSLQTWDQPRGLDAIRANTATPEQYAQRQHQMDLDRGPALPWSPVDNAANFNKVLHGQDSPDIMSKQAPQGGMFRTAMQGGKPVGFSTDGPTGFNSQAVFQTPQEQKMHGTGNGMTSQEHQQGQNNIANAFSAFMQTPDVTGQNTFNPQMMSLNPGQSTNPGPQTVNPGRNREALGLPRTPTSVEHNGGMPDGTYQGPLKTSSSLPNVNSVFSPPQSNVVTNAPQSQDSIPPILDFNEPAIGTAAYHQKYPRGKPLSTSPFIQWWNQNMNFAQ